MGGIVKEVDVCNRRCQRAQKSQVAGKFIRALVLYNSNWALKIAQLLYLVILVTENAAVLQELIEYFYI